MKNYIQIIATLVCSMFLFSAYGQQWSGSNNTTSKIKRTGWVGINTPSNNDALFPLDVGGTTRLAKLRVSQSFFQADQGGSIELGGNNSDAGVGTPYLDFHYNGSNVDYDVRLINRSSNLLSLEGGILRILPEKNTWSTLLLNATQGYWDGPDTDPDNFLKGHDWRMRARKPTKKANDNDTFKALDIYNGTTRKTALIAMPDGQVNFPNGLVVKSKDININGGSIISSIPSHPEARVETGWENLTGRSRYFMEYTHDDYHADGVRFFEFDTQSNNMRLGFTENTRVVTLGEFVISSAEGLAGVWPDYVFEEDHKIMPLSELETYVKTEKHLPLMQSAQEVGENGLSVNQTILALTKQVEELVLHMIEQEKKISELSKN